LLTKAARDIKPGRQINFGKSIVIHFIIFSILHPKNLTIEKKFSCSLSLSRILDFHFGPRVQISAQRPAILTEVFRDFPQSLQANSRIVH
jgi:hypothetical protein